MPTKTKWTTEICAFASNPVLTSMRFAFSFSSWTGRIVGRDAGQRKNTSTRSIAFSAKVPWARVKISLWTTEPSHQVAVVSHKRLLCHLAARMPLLNESQWHQRQNKGVCRQARGLGIDPTAAMLRLRACPQYQEWSHLSPLKCRSTRSCPS